MAGRQLSLFELHVAKRQKTAKTTTEDSAVSESQSSNIKHDEVTEGTSDVPHKIRTKRYQRDWERQFNWLTLSDASSATPKMLCRICVRGKKKNRFTIGCDNYQRSALINHSESKDHADAVKELAMKRNFVTAVSNANKASEETLIVQLRSAYWLMKEEMPSRLFPSLLTLQKLNECPSVVDANIYTHHDCVSDMQDAIDSVIREEIAADITRSRVIGLQLDESIDIAVYKKLDLYLKLVIDGRARTRFAGNINVPDGKAETIYNAVIQYFQDNDIPINKLVGLGSDGAAVMTGQRSGVGVRLKVDIPHLIHIHCVAHRLALVSSQAAASVTLIERYQETVNQVFHYFDASAQRYERLRALQDVVESTNVTLKKPTPVRWLSLESAVKAIDKCWPAICLTLENDATTNAKAHGILTKVKEYSFVAITKLLLDVLPTITRVSKTFQTQNLDLSVPRVMVLSAIDILTAIRDNNDLLVRVTDFKANIQHFDRERARFRDVEVLQSHDQRQAQFDRAVTDFLNKLIDNLNTRFPINALDVLSAFDIIFNPQRLPAAQREIANFGAAALETIVNHFGHQNGLFDVALLRADFLQFKYLANGYRQLLLPDFCEELIMNHRATFPDFASLTEITVCIPITSVECERGFSCQNRIKSKFRSCIGEGRLQTLMRVSIEGPDMAVFDFRRAREIFLAQKRGQKP